MTKPIYQFEKYVMAIIKNSVDDFNSKELTPLIHFYHKGSEMKLEVDLPMVDKDQIEIVVSGDKIIISAKLEKTYCVSRHNCMFEFNYFKKTVLLPSGIDQDHISAKFNNGILTLSMPKLTSGKRIPVEESKLP